jgi:hypothetical protein
MASRRGPKSAGIPPEYQDFLERRSNPNMLRFFLIGGGSSVKQLPISVRHRLRQLHLIEDSGHYGLRLTEQGLQALAELEAEGPGTAQGFENYRQCANTGLLTLRHF